MGQPGPKVVATLSVPNGSESRARARTFYLSALADAGFDVMAIDARDAIPEEFDALCLTGGEDIAPSRYGATADPRTEPPDARRDELEFQLLQVARDRDLPVLGICRGFQVINVAYGGTLVQHVAGHRRANAPIVAHVASPEAGSKLAAACGSAPHEVNSSHHQVVTALTLAPALVPTVRIDGLIEAFEDPAHRWLVAIQWHPERTAEVSAPATRIFRAFADAASRQPARAR